jgi:uncharacterized protein (TIGR00369 family)
MHVARAISHREAGIMAKAHGVRRPKRLCETALMTDERAAGANEFAKDRHPGMVGVEILSVAKDEVRGRVPVTHELVAGTGFLWAPVVITLADWLCAVGIGEHLPEDAGFTTIEIKTNFLGTVREGGAIAGRAWPVHTGRTTHVWDVEVSNEATGKVIALFRCTQMILQRARE